MCKQQISLEEKYIRCMEEITLNDETFKINVCMAPEMSMYLLNAKQLTIDTSFKRVQNWEEFEIERWHDNAKKCMHL